MIVEKACCTSGKESAYSPIIHKATLITRCDLMEPNWAQIFWKIDERCSGCTSITSLMNKMVSKLGKVDFPSNFKKLSIKGANTAGIVSGYDYVMELIDLINRYLYWLVALDYSSILQARAISFSKKMITSLMLRGETSEVANSKIF